MVVQFVFYNYSEFASSDIIWSLYKTAEFFTLSQKHTKSLEINELLSFFC